MKNVAVLLSTYNGEKYLAEQIDSILSQSGVEISLYIRDDGSTDGTKKLLDKYACVYDNIRVSYGKNVGYVNSFAELLFTVDEYEYYAFSDQDDYWEPEKLKAAIDLIEMYNDTPTLYYSNLDVSDETLCYIRRTKLEHRKKTLESVITRRSIAGCTIVINRAMYQIIDVEKHSPDIIIGSHDNYLVTLCYSIGGKVICDPRAYIKYRQHGNNTSGSTNGVIKRIKKEIKEANVTSWNEPMLSKNILDNYQDIITDKSKDTLNLVASFHHSFNARLRAILSPAFATGDMRLTIIGKIKILLNKL